MFYTQNFWCVATAALLYTYKSHHNPNPYQSIFILKRCKFQVGSYSYDDTKMIFLESGRVKGYVETSRSIVLDYDVKINPLSPKVIYIIIQTYCDIKWYQFKCAFVSKIIFIFTLQDRVLSYGSLGNYSLAGFEMILHRYVSHYIITYYLPSGMMVKYLIEHHSYYSNSNK